MPTPLPADATWDDYVNAHGGPDRPGWWVTLCWYDDQEAKPEAIGPYPTYLQAVSAMQDSCLIDGICCDTKNPEWLDDVCVAGEPASIAETCAAYSNRVTVIDPGEPAHFGTEGIDPVPASTVLQAGALATPPPPTSSGEHTASDTPHLDPDRRDRAPSTSR